MLCTISLVIGAIFAIKILAGLIYRASSGRCNCKDGMKGKTVIITGASAGIGKSAAFDIASRGARVIMACRNLTKAQNVADEIIEKTLNKEVIVRQVDTSDLESVRDFAKTILDEEKEIHVLINNAGVVLDNYGVSKQGYELTYATNHLGHFLLTNLLLDRIKASSPSRIINVSSVVHKYEGFDIQDLHFKKRNYNSFKAYYQSKLCNVLFTRELAHKLEGTKVTVNSLHPGVVQTELLPKEDSWTRKFFMVLLFSSIKDSDLGAQTTIHLAVSKDVENITGEYYVDCKIADMSKEGRDPGLAKKFWEISEDEVKGFM